ncbi:MAG: DUF2911 domain-containing protein [Chitinophagaceae bacterium]|nr:DUF2911 domain-containing protein [Chitinophagaceae bacterium]
MNKLMSIMSAIALIVLTACNTGNKNKPEEKTGDAHAAHTMHSDLLTCYADSVNAGLIKEDTLKGSPHRTAMNTISGTHVHIEYNSPGVKGRIIWGGLVAWNKVWVAGAHNATSIRFYKDVTIGGQAIKAGTYALFAIPGKEKWTWILNTNFEQHLTDEYNEKEDVIRIDVVPENHQPTQRLTYTVEKTGEKSGVVSLLWDSLKVALPFKSL